MKGFMKELKPNSLEDIIAGISLYRPGPMDFIPQYIRGKNDAGSITYDCPQLEPILALLTDVLSIRSRLCRSCVTLPDTHWTKRSSSPCHVQEKGRCDAERAPDLCLWR